MTYLLNFKINFTLHHLAVLVYKHLNVMCKLTDVIQSCPPWIKGLQWENNSNPVIDSRFLSSVSCVKNQKLIK